MHSAETDYRTKDRLNISDVGARFGLTKLAAATARVVLRLAVLSTLLIAARSAEAQTETVIHTFTGSDGSTLIAGLTSDGAGNFYGATLYGGAAGHGTIFELSPNGVGGWNETVVYSFAGGSDGSLPTGPVLFDGAGNLYAATIFGGAFGKGTAFELSPAGASWTKTILYNFAGKGGGTHPQTGLVMDAAGNLYGSATYGVFQLSPSGGAWMSKTIYATGPSTYIANRLTLDAAGNIFAASLSKIIELSPNGKGGWRTTVLHKFAGSPNDGAYAQGTLVFDQAGNLYGTTSGGGLGTGLGNGTVFELSPTTKPGKWTEKILYFFQGGNDGALPFAGVVFDVAGNIYGTTRGFGTPKGTVFELAVSGGVATTRRRFSGASAAAATERFHMAT